MKYFFIGCAFSTPFLLLTVLKCFAKRASCVLRGNHHGIVIASYGCNNEENHLTIFRMHHLLQKKYVHETHL